MHLADFSVGAMVSNAIVGANIPIATGSAIGFRLQGLDRVAVSFFGDGASNIGAFHEGLNLAAVQRAPVVFVCENNLYARLDACLDVDADRRHRRAARRPTACPASSSTAWTSRRFMAPPRRRLSGRGAATARPSSNARPTAIAAIRGAILATTGARRNIAIGRRAIPIERMRGRLIGDFGMTSESLQAIEREQQQRWRRRSPSPSPAPIRRRLRRSTTSLLRELQPMNNLLQTTRRMGMAEALRDAMRIAMRSDPRVFLIGEDIGVPGGFGGGFTVTLGLAEEFGRERVIDTPISEAAIVGAAVGAAMVGMRPVAEMQYGDFVFCAMDQVVNQAAKMRYMSNGQVSVPMVLRLPVGASQRGAQHGQSTEALVHACPRA